MSKAILLGVVLGAILLTGLSVNDAFAAAYIKFDGVDGESTDREHKGWSDLGSFSHIIAKQDTKSKRSTVDLGFGFGKTLDKASPKLQEAALQGKVIPKVEIHLTKSYGDAGRQVYYAYELKNVQVTSYNISGQGLDAEQIPVEELALNFGEIKVTYTEYDDTGAKKGNVEYSWKVEEGVK